MDSSSAIEVYFADNYAQARQNFLRACAEKNIGVQSCNNDAGNVDETELATDFIRIGNNNASKLLVLTSGVHGAELMCGSGCQVGMLKQNYFDSLPADTAVVMIHAINPWGAANLRRNNEDNVDLCRNFIDFSLTLPVNNAYEEIHEALCCAELDGPLRSLANEKLAEFKTQHGEAAFVGAVMSGQYSHNTGMSFGGDKPTWSHRTLMKILQEQAQSAQQVCLLDYHSGLGPYGYGSVVCMHDGDALRRAERWFGPWLTAPMASNNNTKGKFHPALGHTSEGYQRALANTEVTSVVLEYGTYDMQSNLQALLDDHCLALRADVKSEAGQRIKQGMLRTHYPDDPEWRYAVWTRSQQLVRQAMRGLDND